MSPAPALVATARPGMSAAKRGTAARRAAPSDTIEPRLPGASAHRVGNIRAGGRILGGASSGLVVGSRTVSVATEGALS